MNYYYLRQQKIDEDFADQDHRWLDGKKWVDGNDCYYLYKLTPMMFDPTGLPRDETYAILCNRILPVVLEGLNDENLYPSSQLESLVNLLDYAYHDLQSPENEKL